MRVISKRRLLDFCLLHPQAEQSLLSWYAEAVQSEWKSPVDIKKRYCSASFVRGNRIVFTICGNRYRLVVRVLYEAGIVYVRFVGTHDEYDAINVETI